jgi:hypothetical protein
MLPQPSDSGIAPYYNYTFAFSGIVFCADCRRELACSSAHQARTDGHYHDQAAAMAQQGWILAGDTEIYCPDCAARNNITASPHTWPINTRPNPPHLENSLTLLAKISGAILFIAVFFLLIFGICIPLDHMLLIIWTHGYDAWSQGAVTVASKKPPQFSNGQPIPSLKYLITSFVTILLPAAACFQLGRYLSQKFLKFPV